MDVSTEDVNTAYETWKAAEGQEKEDALKILLTAVKHYAKRLMLSSKRRNPPDLADEIAEDVILSLETFKGRAKFSTWVGRIILNKWRITTGRESEKSEKEASMPPLILFALTISSMVPQTKKKQSLKFMILRLLLFSGEHTMRKSWHGTRSEFFQRRTNPCSSKCGGKARLIVKLPRPWE